MTEEIKKLDEIIDSNDEEFDLSEFDLIHKNATEILSSFISKSQNLHSVMKIILKRNFPFISKEDYQTSIAIKSIEINCKIIINNLTIQMENTAKAYVDACKRNI